MSRKKEKDRSAPPLPKGEHYDPLPSSHEFSGVKCFDHSRWLSTEDALWRHIKQGCDVRYYKYESRKVKSVVDGEPTAS